MIDISQNSNSEIFHVAAAYPLCVYCKGPTRLYGIEAHARLEHIAIHTYGCDKCDTMEILLAPLLSH
jgi:hypothetical protein